MITGLGELGFMALKSRTLGRGFRTRVSSSGRLGACLVRKGAIEARDLEDALKIQSETGYRLGHVLIEMGLLDEETLADFLSDRYNLPSVLVSPKTISESALHLVPRSMMEEGQLVPIRKSEKGLTVAMVDPTDRAVLRALKKSVGLEIHPVVAPQSSVVGTLARLGIGESLAKKFFDGDEDDREALGRLFAFLEDYSITGLIGQGGFATVFKGYQRSLDRPVAIKTIFKKRIPHASIAERFEREGKIIAKLDHLNIVRVVEQGEVEALFFIVMELIEGAPIDEATKGVPLRDRLDLLIQFCDGLAYSHGKGVLHRDIKPSNILVDGNGVVKILDFGIAAIRDQRTGGAREDEDFILGTPRYMAPEQRDNPEAIDIRADLFSAAGVMYEVLTGSRFRPRAWQDPRKLNPEIPEPLAHAISKCLSENPDDRISNAPTLKGFLVQLRSQAYSSNRPLEESIAGVKDTSSQEVFHKRFELLSDIKREKECRVLLADHKELDRLMLVRQVHSKQGLTEAQILARRDHPHVGRVYGVGEGENHYVVLREYLDGGSLWARMKQPTPNAAGRAIQNLIQIAEALSFAEGLNIYHGHLHPENVLFDRDGRLKVVDFAGPITCRPAMRRFFEKGPHDPRDLDRFSMGVYLFERVTGRQYFPTRGPEGNIGFFESLGVEPPTLNRLLRSLWGLGPKGEKYADHRSLIADLREISLSIGPDPGDPAQSASTAIRPLAHRPQPTDPTTRPSRWRGIFKPLARLISPKGPDE